jgi:hypothetical protein
MSGEVGNDGNIGDEQRPDFGKTGSIPAISGSLGCVHRQEEAGRRGRALGHAGGARGGVKRWWKGTAVAAMSGSCGGKEEQRKRESGQRIGKRE